MTAIVISQPMFFPWVGMFEQLKNCNIFIHYDDVQLPQGRSFVNRVQIKTKDDIKWMTVPIKRSGKSKQKINEATISYEIDWMTKHLNLLKDNYAYAPYKEEMIDLAENTYKREYQKISDLNIFAFESIANYLGYKRVFYRSSELDIGGSSSERLVNIVRRFNGSTYITGLGALNYIDYDLFERNNISIEYMAYKKLEYKQLHGNFTPYVSVLDLIACYGKNAKDYIVSRSKYWRVFLDGPNKTV